MSAIWGVVALDYEENIPESSKEIFENTYKNTCKLDRFESVSINNAYLGCGIQHITKEAKTERLPIFDKEHGIIFTADCILDNRDEIISLLTTQQYNKELLVAEPDGMLMYLTYLCFGFDCSKYFRGLFSIAIWDTSEHSLTLISDQTSSRCLYYIQRGNLVAFSTLLKPLLKLFSNIEPNVNYYKDFLLADPSAIYVVPGETPYQDISLMCPATRLCFDKNGVQNHVYWSPTTVPSPNCRSADEYGKNFLQLYKDCVKDALRSSGEIGIAMSSGLDSSSIGVLAAKELAKNGKSLHSYTFVPYEKPKNSKMGNVVLDESELVSEVAKMYPNMNTTFLNNHGKNIFEDMNFCCELLEMPYKTSTFANLYEICQHGTDKGCKVLLNGGYGNNTVSFGYIQHILYQLYHEKRFLSLLLWLKRYARHEGINLVKLLYRSIKSFRYFDRHQNEQFINYVPANFFLSPAILQDYDLKERFSKDKHGLITKGYINQKSYTECLHSSSLLIYLGIFETKFGLNTGMLLRDPTKDIRMLNFCSQLPYPLFAYNGTPRWLIRNQFTELLPKALLDNWQQHGILNVDWINRIRRDWTVIKPELLQHLLSTQLDKYIAKERLISFIEDFGNDKVRDEKAIVHICAIDGLLRFLLAHK